MAVTPNGSIPLIDQSTTRGYIKYNEAMYMMDAMLFRGVIDKDLSAAPGSPSEGDLYIVKATPAGGDAWEGYSKYLAHFWNGSWHFYAPKEGMRKWVNDDDVVYTYDGSAWTTP